MAGDRVVRFRLEAATQGFQGGMRQAQASTATTSRTIGQSMRANKQAFTMAGAAALGMGAMVGAGLASAVSAGMEFESAMNQVRAVSGATEQEFALLTETARDLGSTTMFSATEAAEGLSFLAMAGFDATEATQALPGVLNLAAAGGMELAEAADIASNVLTGYGLQASEVHRVTDTMAATFTSANTNLSQLGQAMSFVAPVASGAGLALEETSAAIGMMSDAGIQGTRAGTSLRMAISKLLNPTGDAEEAISRLGIQATTSEGELRPLEEIVSQLESSGASTADMMEIFGQRAGPGMAAMVDQGSDSLAELTEELENSGGTAERVAETQMEGLKGAITELGSAWEGLKITVSESGVGAAAETAVDGLTGVVRAAEDLPDPVMRATTTMAGLTTAAGLFGGAVMVMGPRVAEGAAQIRGMTAAMGGLKGMLLRGGAVFTAVYAVQDLAAAWQDAGEEGRETVNQIIEDSDTAAEAVDRLNQSLRDQAEEMGSRESVWDRVRNSAFGAVGAFFNFRDAAEEGRVALEKWRGKADAAQIGAVDLKESLLDLFQSDETFVSDPELGLFRLDDQLQVTKRSLVDIADDAGPRLMDSFGGMAAHAGPVVETVEDLEDALDRLNGSTIGVERAAINWGDQLVDLNDTLAENGATLDINTDKGRINRGAILDTVEAAQDHAVAMMNDGASVDQASSAVNAHVNELKEQMRQAGFSEEAIREYIAMLDLTPGDVRTTLHAETDRAKSSVREYLGLLQEATAKENTLGFRATRAALTGAAAATPRQHGGAVEPGTVYKVGEREPEYLTVGQPGMIHTQTQMTREILGAQGGQLGNAPPPQPELDPLSGRSLWQRNNVTVMYPPNVPTEESIARENRNRAYLGGR